MGSWVRRSHRESMMVGLEGPQCNTIIFAVAGVVTLAAAAIDIVVVSAVLATVWGRGEVLISVGSK